MAEKYEATSSALTAPREFRETVKIGSASSWDKNILALFYVSFERKSFAYLEEFVDRRYFEPPNDDEESSQSASFFEVKLSVVYEEFLNWLEEARDTDFRVEKKSLVRQFRLNPVGPIFLCSLRFPRDT